jgi:hypothetical protein
MALEKLKLIFEYLQWPGAGLLPKLADCSVANSMCGIQLAALVDWNGSFCQFTSVAVCPLAHTLVIHK